jgi:hypothetical protein
MLSVVTWLWLPSACEPRCDVRGRTGGELLQPRAVDLGT